MILRSAIPIAIIHDLYLPAGREGIRDDFRGLFQVQSLQVSNREERAAPGDAANDETCTAGMELPLKYEVREIERERLWIICKYCSAARARARGRGFRVDHVSRQHNNQLLLYSSQPRSEKKKGTRSSRLLVLPPMKSIRDQRPTVQAREIECHPPAEVCSGVTALLELPHRRCLVWRDRCLGLRHLRRGEVRACERKLQVGTVVD